MEKSGVCLIRVPNQLGSNTGHVYNKTYNAHIYHEVSNHRDLDQEEDDETYHAQAKYHRTPEERIVEYFSVTDPPATLHQDYRHLQHHGNEAISTEFAGNATHDELVCYTRDQEGYESGHGTGHGIARCRINVATEEMVDGNVPLARELEPVETVPPVRIELSVGKT